MWASFSLVTYAFVVGLFSSIASNFWGLLFRMLLSFDVYCPSLFLLLIHWTPIVPVPEPIYNPSPPCLCQPTGPLNSSLPSLFGSSRLFQSFHFSAFSSCRSLNRVALLLALWFSPSQIQVMSLPPFVRPFSFPSGPFVKKASQSRSGHSL